MRKDVLFKFLAGIFAFAALIISNCPISNADVAWEPDNNFYRRHAEECKLVRKRDLIVNGPGGKATAWESPVSARKVAELENGSEVDVEYIYTDKRGYTWGIVYLRGNAGWMPMDYLITEPGLSSFIAKHQDEYQEYNDDFVVPEGVERIYFWSYPGSGKVIRFAGVNSGEPIHVATAYTDKDGRQWGYVGYYQAMSGWICMSDPSNDQIPVNEEDAADVVIPPEPTVIIEPQSEGTTGLLLVTLLVAAVVAGTIVLVRVQFRKKTDKTADKGKPSDEVK